MSTEAMAEPLLALDTEFIPPQVSFEPKVTAEKPKVRFAEDILAPMPTKPGAKSKKKKKSTPGREDADGIRRRKQRHEIEIPAEEDEY